MSVSIVSGSTSSTDLLTQSVVRTHAEAFSQTETTTERGRWVEDDATTTWANGLGDRFTPETANSLLSAQETTSGSDSATQQAREQGAFYFDPLDTNRDGKVSYLEWLAGQKTSTSDDTSASAA